MIDFNYTEAAILLLHSYQRKKSTSYFKGLAEGHRYAVHFIYDHPDERRTIATEIRRLRANAQRMAA